MLRTFSGAAIIIILCIAAILGLSKLSTMELQKPYCINNVSCIDNCDLYEVYTKVIFPNVGGKVWQATEIVKGKDTIRTIKKQGIEARKILKEIRDYKRAVKTGKKD